MRRIFLCLAAVFTLSIAAFANDPTATSYPWADCQGTAKPYPAPEHVTAYPDSLTPVMINHVGRHGARFPASAKKVNAMIGALEKARTAGTITPLGQKLLTLCKGVAAYVNGRWGALDSLGMAEQRGIASRMLAAYPMLFKNSQINAISSYSPRCIMSMDEFTHQLARMDNSVELNLGSGRRFSPLMRFFDLSADYKDFRASEELKTTLDNYADAHCPAAPLARVLGQGFDFANYPRTATELALDEFAVLAGLEAMGLTVDISQYLTSAEQNELWNITNFQHYLQYSASTLSSVPSSMAGALLEDLISTTDAFIEGNKSIATVNLRFGHAETLMPLLSLMRLPGCYYLTNIFDTVASHWHDFYVVPMAANLQMILFRAPSGRFYLRTDLNEVPVNFVPGHESVYVPWETAREFLVKCMPLF